MIKKKDIIDYFWTFGNLITTESGVELEMHGNNVVQVSVLLRNTENIEIDGLQPMVHLSAVFEDFEDMQRLMGIEKLEDLKRVSLVDMLRLYAAGIAQLEEIDH